MILKEILLYFITLLNTKLYITRFNYTLRYAYLHHLSLPDFYSGRNRHGVSIDLDAPWSYATQNDNSEAIANSALPLLASSHDLVRTRNFS